MDVPIEITGRSGSKARNIIARQREAVAMARRLEGKSYKVIAAELGVTDVAVIKMVRKGLARTMTLTAEKAEEVREIEVQRLDELINAHWEWAMKGDEKSSAIILRCMERRSAYLGLDAPKRVQVEEKSDIDQQLERLVERIKSRRQVSSTVEIDCTTEPVDPGGKVVSVVADGRARLWEDKDRGGGQLTLCAPEPRKPDCPGSPDLP